MAEELKYSTDINRRSISEFYNGLNILLTGTTGFVGKVVLEKLLRSCKSSGDIYVLIRPKKGFRSDERLQQVLESRVFDRLRDQDPDAIKKIKLISGDLMEPNLGIEEIDRKLIMERVNVVLHSAANVRITESLEVAVNSNTESLKKMIDMCKDIKHLQRFVYVSTTFGDKTELEEIVYGTDYDPNFIIDCVNNLPADIMQLITKKIMGNHPNTYTFSKALAEKLVLEASDFIPTAIVRPSIVHSSWREPFPGWVERMISFTPFSVYFNLGLLKVVICDEELIADLIPVDVVANTIIAAVWHADMFKSSNSKVYNCASGTVNGITYGHFLKYLKKYIWDYPSKHMVSYPNFVLLKNRQIYLIKHIFYHLLPAFLFDVYLYCTSGKPRMIISCKQMAEITKQCEFATMQYRKFHTENFKDLIEAVNKVEDAKDFNIDIRKGNGFNWESYSKNYQLGIRKYILKDDISSLNYAKKKLNRFYWISKAIPFSVTCIIFVLILQRTRIFFTF